ncbi:dTDP-4-dehydrorhamnose 3,5-epimerase family protein [Fluviispira multicolorata]|uniref:dTDP-4-dehydrorhamnose 3,5-epimerase n=1 Tax=Fluviispira multicolorata TaxID=2654512 RepID=A0A833N394_9BACT|nr:dTDP-4-dehydrorhamnose 3,5-epimerase family protein [Fluviispira multicolorata]KAB8028044.1 dTDP-4-dehydrorhamnose 3,5-epimerase [Fluviispira multicolorata]
MIEGVLKIPLRQIKDDRGKVMHMLRATDDHFQKFGEVYFSWINPNVIKGWQKHLEMTLNYAVPVGKIKLVLYDDREISKTYKQINEYILNQDDYYLLSIPPHIWYGFQSIGNQAAMIVNCATIPHDPNEVRRMDLSEKKIPYNWEIEHD